MAFFDFLNKKHEKAFMEIYLPEQAEKLRIQEMMIEHAIDLIAKTIAKSEIQVFRQKGNVITKQIDEVYYRLNVRPNPNQDGTTLIYNVVAKLLREGEALVVVTDNKDLFLADRWKETDHILKGKVYSDIILYNNKGKEFKLNRQVMADDAVHMSLGDNRINEVLDSFYSDYADLISASVNGYKKSNFTKYKMTLPTNTQPVFKDTKGNNRTLDEYVEHISGNLLKDSDTVTALSQTFDLEELSGNKGSSKTSEDTRELIKEYGNNVAMAFNIPLDVYYGSKTDKSSGTNDFITFAVMPVLSIVEDAFNAKLITKEKYLLGERIKFDKFTMKHFDITDVAGSLDKLFAIGWSHNDLREIIGLPLIQEDWAETHHVTKNYMDVNEPILKGGE